MDRRKTLFVFFLILGLLKSPLNLASPPPPLFSFGPAIVGDQVFMSWSAVAGAETYNIYLDSVKVDSVSTLSYTGPLPGEPGPHSYQVSALDSSLDINNQESVLSSPGVIQVGGLDPPENLKAEIGPHLSSIYLVWDYVSGVYQYNIYRSSDGSQATLLVSVFESSYHDEAVVPGVSYGYTVLAIDAMGTEGRSSELALIEIDPASAAAADSLNASRQNTTFNSLEVEEILTIDQIDSGPVEISYMGAGLNGEVWVVVPSSGRIHALDPSGNITITVDTKSAVSSDFIPFKMDRDETGNIFVSDILNGSIAAIDVNGNLLWRNQIQPPPETNQQVWNGFPQHYTKLSPTPSSVLCLGVGPDREVWITDQRFQLVYRYRYDGTFLGYLSHYQGKDGQTWRLRRIGEVQEISTDHRLLTFPLARKAITLDQANKVVYEIGEKEEDLAGVFLGIHGVSPMPGDRILLTDPFAGNVQVYDANDGKYLYHLTWAQGGLLELSRPNMALWGPDGNIWVYEAGNKRIVVMGTVN